MSAGSTTASASPATASSWRPSRASSWPGRSRAGGPPPRRADPTVPRHQGDPVRDARGGHDLVHRITTEVQVPDGPADIEGDGPDVDAGQGPGPLGNGEGH